jgi:hypothetical protein
MISALTTPDQHAGRYPAVTHAQIRRALNPHHVRAGKSGLRDLVLQLSAVEERVGAGKELLRRASQFIDDRRVSCAGKGLMGGVNE